MSVHRRCHCVLCLQHTTLPQQTPLRNSPSRSFCSCVLPNTPSGTQFHSVFMTTRPPATQDTFADAATQLSFAEFFERCILYRALPPRPRPTSGCSYVGLATQCRFCRCDHPTPAHRVLSRVRLLPNDSLDRQPALPSQWNLSGAPPHHPKHISASAAPAVVTFAPLSHARSSMVPSPPGLDVQALLSSLASL